MKHFTVSHRGYNNVKRHINGPVHQRRIKSSQGIASISDVFRKESSVVHSSKIISAEITMAKFIAMHNLSFKAADHLSELLSSMFPDSAIAADFACKRTKTKTDALDPHMKKPVLEIIRLAPFSLLCDKSNDRGDSVKLLTVLARLYDHLNEVFVTRHLETVDITDLTAEGVYNVPLIGNSLSFVSDTCSVMKGVRGGVISKLRSEQPKVIDINCICQLVIFVVKAAMLFLLVVVMETKYTCTPNNS